MTTPRVGERWQITLAGVISDSEQGWHKVRIGPDCMTLHIGTGRWERLADPEPDYPLGTAWKSESDGLIYIRVADGWLWFKSGAPLLVGFDRPSRPLYRWKIGGES